MALYWLLIGNQVENSLVMMFEGIHDVALDDKSRIALPAKLRPSVVALCDSQLVVTRHHSEDCLVVYSPQVWEGVAAQLSQVPAFDEQGQNLISLLVGYKNDIKVDKQGRFLIPQRLRDEIKISSDAVLLGQLSKMQIWEPAAYNEYKQRALAANRLLPTDTAQQSPALQNMVF